MLAVEKWAQGKHPIIALIGPQVASFARDLPDIYRNIKKHQLANQDVVLPHLPTWYGLYCSHKQYLNVFSQFLLETSPLCKSVTNFGDATPSDLMHIQSLSFNELREDFDNTPLTSATWTTVQRFLSQHRLELEFLFYVYLPCLHLYQISPGRMYHKARLGDVKSIDQLLRLDPFLLHDPAIGQQIQKIRLFGKSSTYQNLIEAPLKPLKVKINRSRIKASLGAFIIYLADSINQPLTSVDIRKLFDAVAKDADNQIIDTNIPCSPETFYKSIQRNKPDWKKLTHPDKKR